ncbi:hypothetical protein KXD40_000322 [Peronospora effusa]|uniref:Pentatricopeptide repeat-containing protein-mitochondrial domain-containing protein n=1 Tax=Peronospora effusa TaxID=542832 RepID=A0A3M6VCN1_9STRA|nr:hypothetical protein DD238_004356 [Peronospora effusa]UIZ21159.1 hypothetical protein KXD40_000322 [Peronospora effusa]
MYQIRRFLPALVHCKTHSKLLVGWWQSASLFSSLSQEWRQVLADFQSKSIDTSTLLLATDVENVIQVCTQSDRTREALDAVYKAKKRGVVASLNSHVQICCSWARKGKAERALNMMLQLHEEFGEQFQSTHKTRGSVYDPLLTVFKLQGDWRSTHDVIAQMHQLGITPTLRAFRVLMLTLAKARRKETLLTTMAFVEKKFPEVWTDVATLTAMCQALVSVNENQRVMEIYRKLDNDWAHENASTMLFNQFLLAAVRGETTKLDGKKRDRRMNRGSSSNIQVAMSIFTQMQEAQTAVPDDFTFATYMMELEKRGEWQHVLDLFNTMLETQTRNQSGLSNKLQTPVVNALSCSAVIRALHKLHEISESNYNKNAGPHRATRPNTSSREPQRKLKQDLSVVLKQLHTIDLHNIGHASTLIDTLDEFRLFTAARQIFKRVLDENIIQKTPWRLKDGFEIDLHTFSRGVAKCAVVSAFDEISRSQQCVSDTSLASNTPLQNIRIITGVGKRSQTFMKPVLRQEITELLTKSSRPPLWPSIHPTNPGVLLVRHNALRKWLQKSGAIRYF